MKKNLKFIIAVVVLIVFFAQSVIDNTNSNETNPTSVQTEVVIQYNFDDEESYDSHFEKHQDEFDGISKSEYLNLANMVIQNPDSLMKIEDDGDSIYYLESDNYLVILGTDGYIRTFFRPSDGKDYFERT